MAVSTPDTSADPPPQYPFSTFHFVRDP